jgi:hypothetical protein
VTSDNDKGKRKNGVLPKIGYAVKDEQVPQQRPLVALPRRLGGEPIWSQEDR